MFYVAADQHSKQLTVSVCDDAGDVVLRRQVSTEWERVRQFWAEIRERSSTAGGFVVILEVCGFNNWLVAMLREYGCREVVLVQADERSKTKTDRRDANRLGELLWVNRQRLQAGQRVPGLKRVQPPSTADAEARQLTAMRQRVVAQRTRVINRVRHLLLKHNLAQECPTKGIQTLKAWKWLQTMSLPEMDRLELDQCLSQWSLLDQQKQVLEERIAKRQEADAQVKMLATLPGASSFSSLALSSRIGEMSRFTTPKSLANFGGLLQIRQQSLVLSDQRRFQKGTRLRSTQRAPVGSGEVLA